MKELRREQAETIQAFICFCENNNIIDTATGSKLYWKAEELIK